MATYTTQKGDLWDAIAKKVYGKESAVTFLMEANKNLLHIFVFDAGTVLQVPEMTEEEASTLPPWRRA